MVYLEDGNNSVKNLIMIGTPNRGAPLAFWDVWCYPAINDLKFESLATQAIQNPNTDYYTIYGNWMRFVSGNPYIFGYDDGIVPTWSVNSEDYFMNIGNTFDYHNSLQTQNEYTIARPILLGISIN
ncbi:MAG: hypothetical protein L0H53_08075 [Candidatus Nitrosocosmicus sp.]|nr:hypothetical protein [Candidatus Nitrosocosmicus sp.]MDN5866664.1 hypothetical protein [Candidatus Nitrosocosmicus sp.]